MKKKSRCSSSPGWVRGWPPALMAWAACTISDRAAWRNTWVSRATGTAPESIRSANGLPAPTGGSWSASPMSTTCVPSATASSSMAATSRLSMLDSSTTSRSHSTG